VHGRETMVNTVPDTSTPPGVYSIHLYLRRLHANLGSAAAWLTRMPERLERELAMRVR